MALRVARSLASFSRRTFLKTTALAAVSPLAFARANQDKDKPKNGRLFVFVIQQNFGRVQTDPEMTGMFAVDPDSGVWERVASTRAVRAWFFSSIAPNDGTIAATKTADLTLKPGIWLFNPTLDKEPSRIVEKIPASFTVPLWSADGRRLLASFLITGRENDAAFETFTFLRDGTGLEKLGLAEADIAISWSPDGHTLLVASGKGREASSIDKRSAWPIDIIKIDGTGRRRLVDAEPNREFHSVVFSPDGRSFAYTDAEYQSHRLVRARLWIVDLDSGKRRRVPNEDDLPSDVRWSADGKTLAVNLRHREISGGWIELMDLDGKNRRKIELPFNRPYLSDWR